ncbi:hypothetical protein AMATHDRAFT_134075 [Amanita thiersii Skay4041]|uniref:Phosphotyrosine protein phosphatase I domain-containing protein n=1 Tax=Amanita thiersii Skay4041 TaxID=703135 RepID=A0A2A9P1Y2_9AGAR|nr:hypothetical protein AMATHDRAFT_134075 [Amanita thiersii Skay4041]
MPGYVSLSLSTKCANFVGNICRSPMGEAVLRRTALQRGLRITVDSCGTGNYHVGEDPDERTIDVCREHDVPISHQARQISTSDFTEFTHILASDDGNLRELHRIKPRDSTAEVRLWGSYLDGNSIPDPYYGGKDNFTKLYQQCVSLSNAFLDQVTGTASL